jgi:hypothetical protein
LGSVRGSPVTVDGLLVDASLVRPETSVTEETRIRRAPTAEEAPMLHRLADLGMLPQDELRRRANAFDDLAWLVTEEIIRAGVWLEARGRLVTRRGRSQLRRARWWHAAV